jgi:hypothetical protein
VFYRPVNLGLHVVDEDGPERLLYAVPARAVQDVGAEYALIFLVPHDEQTPADQLTWGAGATARSVAQAGCTTQYAFDTVRAEVDEFIGLLEDVASLSAMQSYGVAGEE